MMMVAQMRPRPRPKWFRPTILMILLGVISYTTLDHDLSQFANDGRRHLAFLDASDITNIRKPYGRAVIDQNFQGLLHPSEIESSLFRSKGVVHDKGFTDDGSACDNVLLFLPHTFSNHGHGSQMNSYLLAAMVSTFTNRAMVVSEPPPSLNEFTSNSQFGCPPEASIFPH